MDWFALGGVLVEVGDLPQILGLHEAFVDAWGLDCPLHSTKIRGRRKEFSWLGRDQGQAARFHKELSVLLTSIPVMGIACVIDRPGYNARYQEKYGTDRWLMCKTAYSIVVERSAKFAQSKGATLEVFYEGAGKEEDRSLVAYHRELKKAGMPFDNSSSAEYRALDAREFQSNLLGDPTRLTKKSPLIQIADLYLYPIVKAGYHDNYLPYDQLAQAGRIIDTLLEKDERPSRGVKYSCFELARKGERPSR